MQENKDIYPSISLDKPFIANPSEHHQIFLTLNPSFKEEQKTEIIISDDISDDSRTTTGRWTKEEHIKFIEGITFNSIENVWQKLEKN